MARLAHKPSFPAPKTDASNDPFGPDGSPTATHPRFSTFDHQLFASGPGASPEQAKRALDAHLADIDRRIQDVGKLGTTLVQQRNDIVEKRAEIETLNAESELNSELRQKLLDIEKEYNDVERDTARALLPKQRVPSNELPGSPYVPDGRGGRRSASPSKLESLATGSPTKLSVPNRKIRNQPSSRVHDIEFAAEISTSLISQVRNLQALLAEKEEELRVTKSDKSGFEIEAENLQQRVKALDENETRYKDENWNLETQIHDLLANQKDSADREKKMAQSLNILSAEKTSTQRELDDVKMLHAKLAEEHEAAVKRHDIELGTAKRNIVMADSERSAMQRKIDDLTNQNQELAKAFSLQRGRALERDNGFGTSDDDVDRSAGNRTPEHSPPPSPTKPTPRHAMLESETLRSSFNHAQRQLQTQKSLLHREKTARLELKRLLQDTRDELEKLRSEAASAPAAHSRRNRKTESREFKRSPRLLGTARSSRTEIFVDDPDWEDQPESTNLRPGIFDGRLGPYSRGGAAGGGVFLTTDASDHFETANETSDAAFETANERATETEDFQTGAEDLSDSDGAATETESPARGLTNARPSMLMMSRESFMSTASTSNDEDYDIDDFRTPTNIQKNRLRLRASRGLLARRSRQSSEEPFQSSPISQTHSSVAGTPQQQGGQSLFAELADLEGSDDESVGATVTPSRSRGVTPSSPVRSNSRPPSVPPLPKAVMVDRGVMTDPVNIQSSINNPPTFDVSNADMSDSSIMADPYSREDMYARAYHSSMGQHADPRLSMIPMLDKRISRLSNADTEVLRPVSSVYSYSDAGTHHEIDMDEKLAAFPVPPSGSMFGYPPMPQVELAMSTILSENIDPISEPDAPLPPLAMTPVLSEMVEPVAEPEKPLPTLSMSFTDHQRVEPVAEPKAPLPTLVLSSAQCEIVDPREEPQIVLPAPALSVSSIETQVLDPVAEPEPQSGLSLLAAVGLGAGTAAATAAALASGSSTPSFEREEETKEPLLLFLSDLEAISLEPKEVPEPFVAQEVEQISEPEVIPVYVPDLELSYVLSQDVEPVSEPEQPAPALNVSSVYSAEISPIEEPVVVPELAPLTFTHTLSQNVEPVSEPQPPRSLLKLSSVSAQNLRPVNESKPSPQFSFSDICFIETTPISPRSPKRDGFILPKNFTLPFLQTSKSNNGDDVFGPPSTRGRNKDAYVIAEDETRQSLTESSTPQTQSSASQMPFQEISSNSNARVPRKQPSSTVDQSTQTVFTSAAMENLENDNGKFLLPDINAAAAVDSPDTIRTLKPQERLSGSSWQSGSRSNSLARDAEVRHQASSTLQLPKQDQHSTTTPTGAMGPPLWPASAMKSRPRTPNGTQQPSRSVAGTPTPKPTRNGSVRSNAYGSAFIHSPNKMPPTLSRQSSVSSFASEIDNRFNTNPYEMGMHGAGGFGPNTDPRMIQAITQTMIGEYLWKYTRKTGRGEMSENRHRRYFWVHPYTRTLYWSERDPSTAGRAEKSKSVPIEAVRVVTDDNPMPPGLYRKSLVIISPGRTIKFTCTTGQRHETWFHALSYLLLRTNAEGQSDAEEMVGGITREDVEEFNPSFGRRPGAGATATNTTASTITTAASGVGAGAASAARARSRPPPSLSSYNSRTTRNESPAIGMSMNYPTLTPKKSTPALRPSIPSAQGRLSNTWWSSTISSLRGRSGTPGPSQAMYEASEVNDSAEDLRQMYEQQDRESERMENVRACCDGKHDVGTLHSHHRIRPQHKHSSQAGSSTATPMASVRSRV